MQILVEPHRYCLFKSLQHSYAGSTVISSILQLSKLKTDRVSVIRPRQHSNNRHNSDLDPCSLTLGSSFWFLCFTWGLGLPLRVPPSGRQLEWLTGRASASAPVLAFWLLPALQTSSPSGAHATGMGRGIKMQVVLQGQTCRSPTESHAG